MAISRIGQIRSGKEDENNRRQPSFPLLDLLRLFTIALVIAKWARRPSIARSMHSCSHSGSRTVRPSPPSLEELRHMKSTEACGADG